ncbi:MAG: hypothetical protein JO197_14435 [Acidobacteria bacterium]|nr:hypothetical protein [Acidobacteriota bacterium]MBV9478743.1 hypothetical protein [Acidobacteriota bacterium]
MTAGAAAAAAIIAAIKASGTLVRVEPDAFLRLVQKQKEALVVYSAPRFFQPGHRYVTSYKGLAFFTKASALLPLPGDVELIAAQSMWMPQ